MVKLYDLILNFENDLLALSVSFVYLFYITTHLGSHQNFSDKELAWGNIGEPFFTSLLAKGSLCQHGWNYHLPH